MSQFKPHQFDDTVNISKEHPLKELAKFLAYGLLTLLLLFFVIGYTAEFIITRIPVEKEQLIWKVVQKNDDIKPDNKKLEKEQAYAERILEKIPLSVRPKGYDFKIIVSESEDPNAFAYLGGSIVITKGLLDTLESENALVFVIGHEMGHYKNRDHLRGMGFGLSATIVSALLAGQDSNLVKVAAGFIDLNTLAYSRNQEKDADDIGLDILIKVYGHAGGATEFFEKLQVLENDGIGKYIPAIISTHPDSDKRIVIMQNKIRYEKIPVRPTRAIRKFDPLPEIEF